MAGFLSLAAQHANPLAKTQQTEAPQAEKRAAKNITAANDETADRAYRAKYEAPCDKSDEKRDSDLCAQWKAADASTDAARWTYIGNWIGGVSGVLVLVALGLAFHSNWIARDTANRQLRAYMSVKDGFCEQILPGKKLGGSLNLINTGQTPARKFRAISGVVIAPADWDTKTEEPDFDGCGVSYIGPGAMYELAGYMDEEIDAGVFAEIGLGIKKMYFIALGEFEDVFGKRHTFRYVFENLSIDSGTFRPCALGNDAS